MLLVSVVMITYHHEQFIKQAIDGVLMQDCNFDIELIIANDNSPDNTDDVIKTIIKHNPRASIIKYVKNTQNIGMMPNFLNALSQCSGKYLALCEGDDYWKDPLKLQKQVDFMETNKDFSMCFHPISIVSDDKNDIYTYPLPPTDVLHLRDLIRAHYIPTCSLLFRNGYFKNGYPKWLYSSISGDIPLEILLAAQGKTKFIPDVMACYRRHPNSISKSPAQIAKTRSGYIYMYSNLSKQLSGASYWYLQYKVFRLRLGYIKQFFKKM